MPYSVDNSKTFLFSWSFKNCAGRRRSATRTWMGYYTVMSSLCVLHFASRLVRSHSSSSDSLSVVMVTRSDLLAIWGLPNLLDHREIPGNKSLTPTKQFCVCTGKHQFRSKGVNFCGVLFCGFFFLRELIFADRGQSAKFAKIRTRKIFMLHSIANFLGYKLSTVRERHYNYHFKDSPVTCLHFLQRRFATSRLWHSWKSI